MKAGFMMFKTIKPEGAIDRCEIVLVGEAPSFKELQQGRPFVGPSGYVLNECLQGAGINRASCYITNVFPFQVKKGHGSSILNRDGELLWKPKGGFSPLGQEHVTRLGMEIAQTSAKIIVALGATAADALCRKSSIMNWRGSVLPSTLVGNNKVMITVHPAAALRGQPLLKYLIRWDLRKAWEERHDRAPKRDDYEFILRPTFNQCIEYLTKLKRDKKPLACDIEVNNRQCSRITFNWSETEGISIPYGDGNWSLDQEVQLWRKTAELLEDADVPKIFHNAAFDVQFLFMIHRILVQGQLDDTMIAHHIMYSDFPKGLYFLGSLYTNQPYWKSMVKHGDIEKSDG